jgi:D-proline reductase (dithiol) PrdB
MTDRTGVGQRRKISVSMPRPDGGNARYQAGSAGRQVRTSGEPNGILFGQNTATLAVTQGSNPMTRLTDLPPAQAARLAELECPQFETRPWVSGTELSRRRVAIVSSAGLVMRGETPFRGRDSDYRVIPTDTTAKDQLIGHISINFDRTGFQEDWNVVFPLDRLNELAGEQHRGAAQTDRRQFPGAGRTGAPLRNGNG